MITIVRYVEDGEGLAHEFADRDRAARWSAHVARRADVIDVQMQTTCDHDGEPIARVLELDGQLYGQCAEHARLHDDAMAAAKRRADAARAASYSSAVANYGRC